MTSESDDEAAARQQRAARRRMNMSARVLSLTDSEMPLADGLTGQQRIELLVEVTAAAWAMTGLPWPQLERAQWPVRVRRLGEEA